MLGLGHHNLTEEETLMAHPSAKLTPHGRLLLVRRVEEFGWRPAQAAEASGVARATVYKWLRRFRAEGSAGLLDRSSRPRRSPRALSTAQVERILRLRRGLKRGPHRLAGPLGHVAIDDASRVAYVEALPDEKESSIVQFVRRMREFFAQHGIAVERLMTDQNRTYRVSRAFHRVLAELGIQHRMTRPYRPQTNGKAERFIQTLLAEWAYLRPYKNNPERLRALARWVGFYNRRRAHTELGDQAPLVFLVNKVSGNYN